MARIFHGCSNLASLDLSSFNTENFTDLKEMFYGCQNLNRLNLSNFNPKNVKDMSGCFSFSGIDEIDLLTWAECLVNALN